MMPPAWADERDDKIKALEKKLQELDERYRTLEKKLESQQKPPPPNEPSPTDESASEKASTLSPGYKDAFTIRSANSNFVARLRGILQVDSRTFVDDGGIKGNDTFTLRRARPILGGTVFRDFDFLFVPEFGGSGSPSIRYAYLNYTYNPAVQARIGKFKVPVSLEQLQSDYNTLFIERAFVSSLAPSSDLGVQLHGEIWRGKEADTQRLSARGALNYSVGVFNGVGDGRTSENIDFDDQKDIVARIFAHPFLNTDIRFLKGLGLGIAGSYGHQEGPQGLPLKNGFATDAFQTFFTYRTGAGTGDATANVIADGAHWRLSPQGYFYYGPFGLLGEYILSSQELARQAGPVTFQTVHNSAWQIGGSYVLTGEEASHRGVLPRRNFDPRTGHWGAFEVVARYEYLDVDDGVFTLLADPAMSATRAAAWGVGLNWYLNRNIQAMFNFVQTDFKGGSSGAVTRQNENVFLTRIQLAF